MRCQICNNITENCSFEEDNGNMSCICDQCGGIINETIGENQLDDTDKYNGDE